MAGVKIRSLLLLCDQKKVKIEFPLLGSMCICRASYKNGIFVCGKNRLLLYRVITSTMISSILSLLKSMLKEVFLTYRGLCLFFFFKH